MSTTFHTMFRPFAADTRVDAAGSGEDAGHSPRSLENAAAPTIDDALSAPMPSIDPSPPPSASVEPRYQEKSVLGRGGMGEVRLCHDSRIGRDVAIKVSLYPTDAHRGRFLREARIQGQLEHPAIVPVHELEILSDGSAYFAMKRVRGRTLGALLNEGKTPLRKLLATFNTVCLAVDFAHSRGVVHRDIKPDNVMVGDFGEVYLLDWGLAKVVAEHNDSSDAADAALAAHETLSDDDTARAIRPDRGDSAADSKTAVGGILGTPGYMAPEQIDPGVGVVGPASDVYALGCVLFEILAGARYIQAKDTIEATMLTLQGAGAHAAQRARERAVPPALDALCAQALALAPSDRPRSARALSDAIESWLAGDAEAASRKQRADENLRLARAALADEANRALPAEARADARARALHELGSAVAVDPSHADARRALLGVLTTVPEEIPTGVQERMHRDATGQARLLAQLTAFTSVSFFVFVPWAFWVGVLEPGLLSIGLAGILAAGAVSLWSARGPHGSPVGALIGVAGIAIFCLVFTRFAGPLVFLPSLLAAHATAQQAHPAWAHRVFSSAICIVTLVIAIGFEIAARGTGEGSYMLEGKNIIVAQHMLVLGPGTMMFLAAVCIASIVLPSIFLSRVRAALKRSEKALHLQTWQLEQLFRDERAS